jgi:7-cyano-7-deazaguanine tRNA-ribosyltransferase
LSFEIRNKDLFGRIGLLHTRHGTVETPLLLPVINPNTQLIPAQEVRDKFGFSAVITNSYLVWRHSFNEGSVPKIHDLLKFDGVIETDSGAYQILQYGDVEVKPDAIIKFQERLDSDIGVILDVPTNQEVSKQQAQWTVDETLRRAKKAQQNITRRDILWVGPVQGGVHTDLVAKSAREIAKLNFQIHALGSPTTVMQQYQYDKLVDMIMAAKLNSPADRPLHLFGAGHPMMFALAIALGCDMFDSASYALFARNDRYLTPHGTAKLEDLEYFPCTCPACYKKSPEDVKSMLKTDRERILAAHNLYACQNEIRTVKQAIVDGHLWELVEARSFSHPALKKAFDKLLSYAELFELETPIRKKKGPFIISEASLHRPEIVRYQLQLGSNYMYPKGVHCALLLPEKRLDPFRKDLQDNAFKKLLRMSGLHVCAYSLVFGIIPGELMEVYPLSQMENSLNPTSTAKRKVTERILEWLRRSSYKSCIIVVEEQWQRKVAEAVQTHSKKIAFRIIETKPDNEQFSKQILFLLRKRPKRMR